MTLKAESYRMGTAEIHLRGLADAIEISALRIYGERMDKSSKEHYWDITQTAAIAAILPFLENSATMHDPITLFGRGYGARKTITVQIGGAL